MAKKKEQKDSLLNNVSLTMLSIVAVVALVSLTAIVLSGAGSSSIVLPGGGENAGGQASAGQLDCDWVFAHPDEFKGTATWESCSNGKAKDNTAMGSAGISNVLIK